MKKFWPGGGPLTFWTQFLAEQNCKQESPPAWTQEAYRPPCSEYSFCCPTRVPPPGGGGTWPGHPPRGVPDPGTPPGGSTWAGYPPGGYLTRVPPLGGVPDPGPPGGGTWARYPPGGYLTWVPPPGGYLTRVPPPGGYLTRVPPPGGRGTWAGYPPRGGTWPGYPPRHCLMAFWEMLQSIMGYGYPPLWTDRWMDGRTDACQNITFPHTPYAGGNKTYGWVLLVCDVDSLFEGIEGLWPNKTLPSVAIMG